MFQQPLPPRCSILLLLLSLSTLLPGQAKVSPTGAGWPTYGGDPGGQRYSDAGQITRLNVDHLHPVWTYHTGALKADMLAVPRSDFEATPILFNGTLYLDTPFDRVVALDPATGAERWTFDPQLPRTLQATNYTSRGVAAWQDSTGANPASPCASRIFVATLDARLIALDARNGTPCDGFGQNGHVDLKQGIAPQPDHPFLFYGNTSPATVVGDTVVVGSAVADNVAVNIESGSVRGFDARTGALLWVWDPLPWARGQQPRTGAGNAWSVLAADPVNHLVIIPTGSAAPDFWGGFRKGDNRDANSVVALDARTGKKVWAFQLVHHDVWDYDVAAEPLLFDYHGRPAVAVAAKTGIIFVLDRLTGKPLIPVEERPVPASDIPGESVSPTQPFTALAVNPLVMNPADRPMHSLAGSAVCDARMRNLRYEGIFTPPGLRGTLQYPGSLGGVNWGSMSYDPETATLYANNNGSAYEIKLVPQPTRLGNLLEKRKLWLTLALLLLLAGAVLRRSALPGLLATSAALLCIGAALYFKPPAAFTFKRNHNLVNSPDSVGEISPNQGSPYRIFRRVLQDEDGRPCTPLPWGATTALNLGSGTLAWRMPLGTLIPGQHTGTVNFGAPIVTAGGLLFTAATSEPLLRAIDKTTGEEVWTGNLPVPAQSTPMTYLWKGRQYVVVAAGGHGGLGTPLGDSLVAFAL